MVKQVRFSESEHKSGLIELIHAKDVQPSEEVHLTYQPPTNIQFTDNVCEFMHLNNVPTARVLYCETDTLENRTKFN